MARGRHGRSERPDFVGSVQDRTRIAHGAARLIAEHGIADWALAKRKAARTLMVPERTPLPGDDEVEAALAEYHAIFGGEEHAAVLHGQREEALRWLRRLAAFRPRLVGGVAEGWATEHSDIRVELTAEDPKPVELELINADIRYRTIAHGGDGRAELYVDTPAGGLRLIVRSPAAARQLPRRDRRGHPETRLDADALAALLARDVDT